MSVFRAANANTTTPRDAYPMNLPKEDAFPDGPTERISERISDRPRRRRWAVPVAVLLAILALAVAVVALLTARRAVEIARAMAAAHHVVPAAPAPAVTPGGAFAVSYAQEPLRVQIGCSSVMYLDLDEPRANAAEKVSDLRYDSRCGQDAPRLTLGPGAAGGSQIKSSDTDAAGCEEAIRTSPIGPGASVEVRPGVVLCVLTAATPAEMVLLEITDVGQAGTAGMRATSWRISG